MGYWEKVEPYWQDLPTDDPAAYLQYLDRMPVSARALLTTHWVYSEVCNGGLHQLFTNSTGVVIPEAIAGFRSMALPELAAIVTEAARFFGEPFPRDQARRIEALERYERGQTDPDDWNPFAELDERFYAALGPDDGEDAYVASADRYAGQG